MTESDKFIKLPIIKSGRPEVIDGLIYNYFKTEEEFNLFLIKHPDFIKNHNGCYVIYTCT